MLIIGGDRGKNIGEKAQRNFRNEKFNKAQRVDV